MLLCQSRLKQKDLSLDARLVGRPHRQRDGGRRFRAEGVQGEGEQPPRRPLGGDRWFTRNLTERSEGEGSVSKPVAPGTPRLSRAFAHLHIMTRQLHRRRTSGAWRPPRNRRQPFLGRSFLGHSLDQPGEDLDSGFGVGQLMLVEAHQDLRHRVALRRQTRKQVGP